MVRSLPRASRLGLTSFLVVALLAGLALPAVAASVEERRLRQAQGQLAEVRERLKGASAEREAGAAQLEEAEQALAAVLEAVRAAELAVQRQQQTVEASRRELARLEEASREHRQVMASRAVTLYRNRTTASWGAVLAAGDAEEALARSAYVEVVSRADRSLLERVEIDQVAVDAQRATLEAEEAALERVLAQQRQIHAEAEELRNERALRLARVEERLAGLQAQERHLESESRELAALARRANQARQAASRAQQPQAAAPARASSGGWVWPARGSITSGFGMRWGRMHEGIDIGGRRGAPVVAARDGQVSFAGRMGGYGNLVLVSHGGGIVTAYAHLSSFAVASGQRVSAGQRIGAVGCTGSCSGPHLHFEVRVNGAARNPQSYLP